uniref:BACK domain-containing protein n=1 Tax=Panagrolaimus superbus TaxID=310955 RepID=A0A914Z8B9_9BILA
MAEFYAVQGLKNFCDKFLAASKKSVGKIEELYDVAEKYSLSELKKSVGFFFCHHVKKVCNSEVFITFKKPFVEFLFTVGSYEYNKETGFKAVYKWAEHRVLQDQAVDGDRNFNLQEAIKVEFSTFLPKFNFLK